MSCHHSPSLVYVKTLQPFNIVIYLIKLINDIVYNDKYINFQFSFFVPQLALTILLHTNPLFSELMVIGASVWILLFMTTLILESFTKCFLSNLEL